MLQKTIFFHQSNDYSGSTLALLNVIKKKYYDQNVIVVTEDKYNAGFLTGVDNITVKHTVYPKIFGHKIWIISSLISRLSQFYFALFCSRKYDCYYINTIVPYNVAIAAKLLHKKVIWHIHEKFFIKWYNIIPYLESCVREYVFNHISADKIFVSEYVKGQYDSKKGIPVVEYNVLSQDFVRGVDVVPIQLREKRSIVMLCSLTKAKGICIFLKVARSLPEYKFTLVISASQKKIDSFFKSEVPRNVKIVAGQKDVHPFYKNADLVLNLSDPSMCVETFGMTIIEGLSYGLPAIVPNIGGPIEIISDGFNGFCVDVTNITEICAKVKYCLSYGNYERLAKNAIDSCKKFI